MFSAIFSSSKKPALADLHAFALIAELRSFRQAADRLGVTPSSLSHAMRGLEQALDIRLLHRTTRSVALTEAGQRLLADLLPVLQRLDTVLGDAAGLHGQAIGTLRINGSEGAIRLLLQRVVPAFSAQYPQVELDLVADGRFVDIVAGGFDAGIRFGEAIPQDMVAVRLSPDFRFLAVAAPAYLQARTAPDTPDQLTQHQCIRQRLPSGKRYRWEFSKHGQDMAIDVPGTLTLDNVQLMLEAALAGLGIAYLPELYAAAPLREGRLRAVLEDWCPAIAGLHLYFPQGRHQSATLRAFIEVMRRTVPADLAPHGQR
ncbi:transcriptional regulator, LysR family [Pseudoduganella lurida]|uniref:Transcriptional regulator, LysR family n=1 Tax=Pseudoduganella lurida TaxID=1036180 RepID=A0A562R0N3_9BURK|nr:LysR family transcriptional regulator [Pseudoduganella lurida]TWI62611.1 transcriptional regulator, LysR family [Pseudoduganella lurida]